MARYAGVTQWQVRQVWQAADLKPYRLRTFKLSQDPQFAEKVIDVVGLYLNPPDNALVLSSTRRRRSRPSTRPIRCCPCGPGRSSVGRTITRDTGPPICMRPSTSLTGRCSDGSPAAAALWSSGSSSPRLTARPHATSRCTDSRQQQHAHDRRDSRLPGRASALSPALHGDQCCVAQRGRDLVRAAATARDPARRLQERDRTAPSHPSLH